MALLLNSPGSFDIVMWLSIHQYRVANWWYASLDPINSYVIEAFKSKDHEKKVPIDLIKGFFNVKFYDKASLLTALPIINYLISN